MIDHARRFIFIHQPRTAGTSIEYALRGTDWWFVEPRTKHLAAAVARQVYPGYWQDYLKFSVIRDQRTWLESLHATFGRGNGRPQEGEELAPHPCGAEPMTLEEFIRQPRFLAHERGFTADQKANTTGVDFILRFESLRQDWPELCERLRISVPLPWMNRR